LRLRAEGVGFFPDARYPRVVWVGLRDEREDLARLQRSIEEAVQPFAAEKPENRFTGHVTLGRIRGLKRPEAERLAQLAGKFEGKVFGEWTGTEVELVRSELLPSGARHTVLSTAPLVSAEG
jgi:2'-5' RNA ligase